MKYNNLEVAEWGSLTLFSSESYEPFNTVKPLTMTVITNYDYIYTDMRVKSSAGIRVPPRVTRITPVRLVIIVMVAYVIVLV